MGALLFPGRPRHGKRIASIGRRFYFSKYINFSMSQIFACMVPVFVFHGLASYFEGRLQKQKLAEKEIEDRKKDANKVLKFNQIYWVLILFSCYFSDKLCKKVWNFLKLWKTLKFLIIFWNLLVLLKRKYVV